ncbi:MAG: hypothetical protein C5B60_01580 [Chloroflexi bacterium]|nr:MAG: hypothetical protein C5B60_01580 [Chloroflexota bacterium]
MPDYTVPILEQLLTEPALAHEVLFHHRHANRTPAFHKRLISLFHSKAPQILALCFRGSGKSTIAEEAVTVLASAGLVKNVLLIGESWLRACDRLRAIRRELETNEWLQGVFGEQLGDTWQESRLILNNGTAITASGAGQALRGTKHLEFRPDLCFVDDLESFETVATEDARRKLSDWFYADLLPALDPKHRIIVLATPLHPQSLAMHLSRLDTWQTEVVPIEYIDDKGVRKSSWPDRFPLSFIDDEHQAYVSAGKVHKWAQEMMMLAQDRRHLMFVAEHFRFEPHLSPELYPVYVAIDPARTIKETSSTTGIVAASWIGRRLVVWEAEPARITPSELVERCFALENKYQPVAIGVERDGLEEFLLQPLRHEQLKRAQLLPIVALKAPRGKSEFIARLQPLFAAGDIVFGGDENKFRAALDQFLAFPAGLIDVPNALAYLLEMRAGAPVFEDVGPNNIVEHLILRPGVVTMALHASPFGTAAVLFQYMSRVLFIYRDFVSEADAGVAVPAFIEEARLFAGRITAVLPPEHYERRNSYGLQAACRGRVEARKGGDLLQGRAVIRELSQTTMQGVPRLLISRDAGWTVRALTGGYAREVGRDEPSPSLYATLAGALEAALAPLRALDMPQQRTAMTRSGVEYATAEASPRRLY